MTFGFRFVKNRIEFNWWKMMLFDLIIRRWRTWQRKCSTFLRCTRLKEMIIMNWIELLCHRDTIKWNEFWWNDLRSDVDQRSKRRERTEKMRERERNTSNFSPSADHWQSGDDKWGSFELRAVGKSVLLFNRFRLTMMKIFLKKINLCCADD